MARPRKQGLDYFPLDVDFFSDEKIICISGEFGIAGQIVALKLLSAIYRNGYYVQWNEATAYKIIHDLRDINVDTLNRIVERLAFWGFFDRALFESEKILTSRGIQNRYFEAIRRRQSDVDLPYILVNSAKTDINVDNNPQCRAQNVGINATKESKVKERKEKENNNPPLTPPVGGEPTRQGAESEKDFLKIFYQITPEDRLNRRLTAMKIDRERFDFIARIVLREWADDEVTHSSATAAARHLLNHVRKKLSAEPRLRSAPTDAQIQRQQSDRQAQRRQRDQADAAYRASVAETGMNGFQQWCRQRGIDPATASARDLAMQ